MATQENLELAQQLFVAYYGRPADAAGQEFWADQIEANGVEAAISAFGNSEEYTARFGDLSSEELVNGIYQQAFGRDAEAEGLEFWTGELESGAVDLASIALAIVQGASDADAPDASTLAAKVAAAELFTANAGEAYAGTDAANYASEFLAGVDASTDVEGLDIDGVVSDIPQPQPEPTPGEAIRLTQRADDLTGTNGDDTFEAPVTQNETGSGALANTLETGDVLNGGEGTDTLRADLIATGTIQDGQAGVAISPETTSVENVFFRAQAGQVDTGFNNNAGNNSNLSFFGSTIDAERMVGVEQWWTDNSRADVQIEDIRSNPAETTFGVRETDPSVNYSAFLNANFLEGGTEEGASAFNFVIRQTNDLGAELQNIAVTGVRFELNGESYELGGADVEAANTWAELQTALQADVDSTEGLAGLTVEHRGNGQFVVTDPNAGDFVINPVGTVASISTTQEDKAASLGVPQVTELPTETAVVLDGAGNGSQGGMVDVGVMSGSRGVEVFNTSVLSDSHIVGLQSSNLRSGDQYLEEVYLDGEGDLTLGNTDTSFEARALNGLTDVRVLDASNLDGSLNAGVQLTNNSIGRYLDEAEGAINFEYTGTANDDQLNFNVANAVSQDPDFAMQINAGEGDDLINLVNSFELASVSLNGGEGEDTLETASNIGTGGTANPAAFTSIENLVLTGFGTDAGMNPLAGVGSVTIATNGGIDTDGDGIADSFSDSSVSNLEADTTLTISGERQTLDNDSNNDQNFGVTTLTNAGAQSQLVTLDNTARVDGVMTVNGLTVDGTSSAVRELTVDSDGRRDTSNVVNNINAALVTGLVFTGSQSLAAEVDTMGQNANGVAQAFTVSGAELERDFDLDIEASLISASNARDQAVSLTGADSEGNTLTLAGNGNALDITTGTTVNGFETVVLSENFAGDIDATNFNNVDLYNVADLGGATTVTNLNAGQDVVVSDQGGQNGDLTLEGPGEGSVNVTLQDTAEDGLTWSGNQLAVNDFADINLTVEQNGNEATGLDLLLDNYGVESANEVDGVADNLVITGGNSVNGATNSLQLTNDLPASLDMIDVSGYEGTFTAGIENAVDDSGSPVNDDIDFVLGTDDVNIALSTLVAPGDATGVDFNSTFEFTSAPATQDSGQPAATWTIENFVAQAFTGADSNNRSVLDVEALDISSFTDFDFVDVDRDGDGNLDVVITEETANPTWEIVLLGVTEADLNLSPGGNFEYA